MDVAIVGGTGPEGSGLALRLASVGHHVIVGSRAEDRARTTAAEIVDRLGGASVEGMANADAVAAAPVVFVTVPFVGQADTYRSLRDAFRPRSIVCDATAPLATAIGGRAWQVLRPWHGSAAEQAAAILGDRVRIVAAFHTISATSLAALERPLDSDVLVCGDDAEAKATVGGLIDEIAGARWVDCGDLAEARIAETLTALLISVNRTYRVHDAGFRLTGRDGWGQPGA